MNRDAVLAFVLVLGIGFVVWGSTMILTIRVLDPSRIMVFAYKSVYQVEGYPDFYDTEHEALFAHPSLWTVIFEWRQVTTPPIVHMETVGHTFIIYGTISNKTDYVSAYYDFEEWLVDAMPNSDGTFILTIDLWK